MTEEQELDFVATSVIRFLMNARNKKEADSYTLYNQWSESTGIVIKHEANVLRVFEMLTQKRNSPVLDNPHFRKIMSLKQQ